jgi:hypothetical protein
MQTHNNITISPTPRSFRVMLKVLTHHEKQHAVYVFTAVIIAARTREIV